MQRFFGVSQDTSGNAIPSVTVTVNLAGTATLATLFSDNSYTPLANPFTSNTDGTYLFYSHNGRYDVVLVKTGFAFTNSETSDVLLYDSSIITTTTPITIVNSNVETDIFNTTIRGGTLGTNRGTRVLLFGKITNTAGVTSTPTIRHYYGGVELTPLSGTADQIGVLTGVTDGGFMVESWLTANNSAAAQNAMIRHTIENGSNNNQTFPRVSVGAVSSGSDQIYRITFQWNAASNTRSVTITNGMMVTIP